MNLHWIFAAFGVLCYMNHVGGTANSTKKRASEDYYQVNYDYEVFNNNNSLDVEFSSDSLILPIPEETTNKILEKSSKNDVDDGDLKDHNFIDNLMYIYYGPENKNGHRFYSTEIIIAGSLLSCVAQISSILLVFVKTDIRCKKDLREFFLNMIWSFHITNLAFVFGIFKTKNCVACLVMAFILTYFHLISAVWIFLYCFYIYKVFCENERPKRKYIYFCGYVLPLLYTWVAFMLAPQSYELQKFCFMSVQRGMILNYMVPVFCLMILTAVYCIKGIRIFNMELHRLQVSSNLDTFTLYNNQMEILMGKKCGNIDAVNLRGSKSCLRRLCVMQTTYAIVWFFLVLALENIKEGSSTALVYAFTTCCLNWYILAELKIFFPTDNKPNLKEVATGAPKRCNGVETVDSSPTSSECKQESSDSVPLLVDSTELKVLQHNPNISTISN